MTTSGIPRRINREKLDAEKLAEELRDPASMRYGIYSAIKHMLDVRRAEPSFSPFAEEEVLETDQRIFALRRGKDLLVLINVSNSQVEIDNLNTAGIDILTGESVEENIALSPYQVRWIRKS